MTPCIILTMSILPTATITSPYSILVETPWFLVSCNKILECLRILFMCNAMSTRSNTAWRAVPAVTNQDFFKWMMRGCKFGVAGGVCVYENWEMESLRESIFSNAIGIPPPGWNHSQRRAVNWTTPSALANPHTHPLPVHTPSSLSAPPSPSPIKKDAG